MTERIKDLLQRWVSQYHVETFIKNDPIQFPHRFELKTDIEISAFIASHLTFGRREQTIKKVEILHSMMGTSPTNYVHKGLFLRDIPENGDSFYRTVSNKSIRKLYSFLQNLYDNNPSMEDALIKMDEGTPRDRLCRLLSVSNKTPQKKLNMFLRWMIRQNSPVDLGIWKMFNERDLIIPLDTHVLQVSNRLGLIDSKSLTLSNALKITTELAKVFPNDPCLGDFALFGYGEDQAHQ